MPKRPTVLVSIPWMCTLYRTVRCLIGKGKGQKRTGDELDSHGDTEGGGGCGVESLIDTVVDL